VRGRGGPGGPVLIAEPEYRLLKYMLKADVADDSVSIISSAALISGVVYSRRAINEAVYI